MATQRLTITLPDYLYNRLIKDLPSRQISQFVSRAIEEKILPQEKNRLDAVEAFFAFGEKLPKIRQEEILKAIEEGRQ